MRKRLSSISQVDFDRFLAFANSHARVVRPDHMLQKLTIFNFVAPLIARYKPAHILEIGCGLGFHSALLTNYGQVSATELQVPGSFVAADADIARDRELVFQDLAKGKVQFQYNDGRTFPFPDESFDLIFHNSVIEHVPDAAEFNRETSRMLRPNGTVICITGTPALCWFRLIRDYFMRLPITMAASVVKELGVTRRLKISDQIKALIPAGASEQAGTLSISGWNARLSHYVYSPVYNAVVLEALAKNAGVGKGAALVAAYQHFRKSLVSRFRYYLTPKTHGQHYRDFRHEMTEWRLDRWRNTFEAAGFDVVEIIPYRFHHLLEASFSDSFNSALYHRAAPLIERFQRRIPVSMASEFVLVARKRPGE